MENKFLLGVLGIGFLLQAGCADRVELAKQEIEKVKATNSTKNIEPLPKISSYPSKYYQPVVDTQLFYQMDAKLPNQTNNDVNQSGKKASASSHNINTKLDVDNQTSLLKKPKGVAKTLSVPPDAARITEPLTTFNFNGLVFKGIVITPQGETLGLIELPNRQLITVKKGDYLGNKAGKVIAMSQNFLQIEQASWDGNKVVKIKKKLFLSAK